MNTKPHIMTKDEITELRHRVEAMIFNMAEAMGYEVQGEPDTSVNPKRAIHSLCEILDQFENTLMSQAVWDGLLGTHETKQRLQKHMEAYWLEEFGKPFKQEIEDDLQLGYLGAQGILYKRRIFEIYEDTLETHEEA